MRGFIYEISSNKEELEGISESDFYERAGVIANWFQDTNEEPSCLLQFLEDNGAEIGTEEEVPYFVLSNTCKENIFRERFEKLKQSFLSMDLHTFSTSSLYELLSLIEDKYDDAVYTGSVDPTPLDRWIREAETGVRYYVGSLVIMH